MRINRKMNDNESKVVMARAEHNQDGSMTIEELDSIFMNPDNQISAKKKAAEEMQLHILQGEEAVEALRNIPADPREAVTAEEVDKELAARIEEARRDVNNKIMAMSTNMKHAHRKSVTLLYQPLPEDEVLDFGVTQVKVSPKIPYSEVMDAVQWAVSLITAGRAFISEPVKKIVMEMAIVKYFTDLEVIEDELLDQYDILMSADALDRIMLVIDPVQTRWFNQSVEKTVVNIINYQNSAAGIIAELSEAAAAEDSGLNKILKTVTENEDLLKRLTPFVEAYQELGDSAQVKETNKQGPVKINDHKKKK